MKTKKPFQSKSRMRKALELLNAADDQLHAIRDHFDMEWGENSHSELDTNLLHAIGKIIDAKRAVEDTLAKYKGKSVTPHFPTKRKAKPAVTVGQLQKALVC